MKIGFVFTNYNNSAYTRQAVKSLVESAHVVNFHIVVVDNQSRADDIAMLQQLARDYPQITVIFNKHNLGYFRGLNIGIGHLRECAQKLDMIVVGNNDLVFPADFYDRLTACQHNLLTYAVVSPDLITLDGEHQNPHVRDGISAFRELVWDVYYANYALAIIINWVASVTRHLTGRKDYTGHRQGGVIFQGYGACYILTPLFFEHFEELWAPTFLMGEEYFLWKQLTDSGQELYYEPGIVVRHHDHATTDEVPARKLWEICRESHFVYKKYRL